MDSEEYHKKAMLIIYNNMTNTDKYTYIRKKQSAL